MSTCQQVALDALSLPGAVLDWLDGAPLYESSGASGARTLYVGGGREAFLKIAPRRALERAAQMQHFFSARGLSPRVLAYWPLDRDYLVTARLLGEDGVSPRHLDQPERLSELFGRALRGLHEADPAGCPVQGRMAELMGGAQAGRFQQDHLELLAPYIGPAQAALAGRELAEGAGLLREETLIHGDYCLPNILIENWRAVGFIDVAEGGVGDRHYDLAWGLWTIRWNLHSVRCGQIFLDAYGRERIDGQRLRLAGLLAALE